jgi:hypothetical protein
VTTFDWGEVWSKVVSFVKSFLTVCGTPPSHKEVRVIPDFQWLGIKLAIWLSTFSLGHNLCFNYPNGSCKTILKIYVPIAFKWYKGLFNPMGFDPWNGSLKIQKFVGTPTPKMGAHLGVWKFIPSQSPTFPHSREHEMWLLSFTLGLHLRKPLLWSQAQG